MCTAEAFAHADTEIARDPENLLDVYVYDRRTRRISWVSVRRWVKWKEPIPACSGKAGGGGPPDISGNGRFVAFATGAPHVVRGDTNRMEDVFVRDVATHRTVRASVSSSGKQANRESGGPALSDDGRYVAFCSLATNLTRARVPLGGGIFVRDLKSGKTTLVSVTHEGRPLADRSYCSGRRALSAHGRYLAFLTESPDIVGDLRFAREHEAQLVVADLRKRTFDVISTGTTGEGANSGIETVQMTPDGRYLAFATLATNMVHGDRNGITDVFWFDRVTRRTVRVSVRSDGTDSLSQTGSLLDSISADGRWVTWETNDSDVLPGEPRRPSGEETYDVFVTGPLH
jgi:Tol biopolymer transport system component